MQNNAKITSLTKSLTKLCPIVRFVVSWESSWHQTRSVLSCALVRLSPFRICLSCMQSSLLCKITHMHSHIYFALNLVGIASVVDRRGNRYDGEFLDWKKHGQWIITRQLIICHKPRAISTLFCKLSSSYLYRTF